MNRASECIPGDERTWGSSHFLGTLFLRSEIIFDFDIWYVFKFKHANKIPNHQFTESGNAIIVDIILI